MAAPNGLIVAWPSASAIPSGWTRYTAADTRFPQPASAGLAATGGSDTHTHPVPSHTHTDQHTHDGTPGASGATGTYNPAGSTAMDLNHTPNATAQTTSPSLTTGSGSGTSAASSHQVAQYTVRWIKSDGTTDIPVGAIAWTNQSTMPTGWQAHAASINYYLRGAVGGANGGTATAAAAHSSHGGGSSHTHTHSVTSHTHTAFSVGVTSPSNNAVDGAGANALTGFHGHAPTGATGAATHNAAASSGPTSVSVGSQTPDLAYYKLQHVEATSAVAAPMGIIGMLDTTTVPSGWAACDGTQGTPNINGQAKYIKGANGSGEIGTTGGGTSHTHTDNHYHFHSTSLTGTHGAGTVAILASATSSRAVTTGGTGRATSTHTHSAPTSWNVAHGGNTSQNTPGYDANTFEPPYITLLFIMKLLGVVLVTVTGNQPAASGTIAKLKSSTKSLAGNQPSATGTLAARQTLLRAVAGNQPFPTGTVAFKRVLTNVALAGAQPSATGTVAGFKVTTVTLQGNQPFATGRVRVSAVTLRGNQAFPAGRLRVSALRLQGNQPFATGVVTVKWVRHLVAGNQPFPTGALTVVRARFVNLAGNQPSATGILRVTWVRHLVVGAQPAPSGIVTAHVSLIRVTLQGNQSAPSGALTFSLFLHVLILGNQPFPRGTVTAQVPVTGVGFAPVGGRVVIDTLAPGLVELPRLPAGRVRF